jgi:hypothetical protein
MNYFALTCGPVIIDRITSLRPAYGEFSLKTSVGARVLLSRVRSARSSRSKTTSRWIPRLATLAMLDELRHSLA